MTNPCTAYLGAAILLVGCGKTGRLELEGEVGTASQALASDATIVLGAGDLVIQSARVSVSEIELEGGKEGRLSEREAELGPAEIDLELGGGPTLVATDHVEAGKYHTLGIELVQNGDSILVSGVYRDAPFTWASSMGHEVEFRLDPQVDVPADGEAVAGVVFEVGHWFTSANGAVLDPTDPANQAAIEARILDSLAAHAAIEREGTDDD